MMGSGEAADGNGEAASVGELISTRYAQLSPSHRRIADFVLASPHEAALMTIDKFAQAAGASASTANRFGNRLGLNGYSGLAERLRDELRGALQPIEELVETVSPRGLSPASPWARSMADDIDRIRQIRAEGGDEAFVRATNLLATARRVYLVGLGSSAYIAQYADFYLSGLRDGTEALESAGGIEALSRKLLSAGPQDAALQLAFARYSALNLQIAATFKRLRVPLIGITDDERSPLVPYNSITIFVGRKPGFLLSGGGAGTLSLIEALLRGTANALGSNVVRERSGRLTAWLGETIITPEA